MENISIVEVISAIQKEQFVKLPWKIYKDNINWVPPLIMDVKNNLDTKKNPFYKHSKIKLFLAMQGKEVVGRIGAIINDNHNEFHNDKAGFYGFFECINDKSVAEKLFAEAEKFVRENGMNKILGPVNPSTNDECGTLITAFDKPPVLLMPFNPDYYPVLTESCGYKKANDLLSFYMDAKAATDEKLLEKLERMADIVAKKENIKIRYVDLSDFNKEVLKVRQVYNAAWEKNWGFVPMTEDEMYHIAKMLKLIVNKEYVMFAEINGVPIGFSLSLPDYNQVFKKMNGRLFPTGIFKFLANKKKIDNLRILIMGVTHEYQRKGIDAIFYLNTIKNGIRNGIKSCEIAWVLEDNHAMVQTANKLGAKEYKRFRIYEKIL
jgi:hypothetical protein